MFVMAKSEYGDRVALSDGRVTMLKFHMGKTLDTAALLELMRYLRAVKQEVAELERSQ
jgi:hypothetical protein